METTNGAVHKYTMTFVIKTLKGLTNHWRHLRRTKNKRIIGKYIQQTVGWPYITIHDHSKYVSK